MSNAKLIAFWSRFLPEGKKLAIGRLAVLTLLVVGMASLGAADGVREYDGFEDGDYGSSPQWFQTGSGSSSNFNVQTGTAIKGSYSLEIATNGNGNKHILTHDRGSSDSVDDGDIYQFWMRTPSNQNTIQGLELVNEQGNFRGGSDSIRIHAHSRDDWRIESSDSSGSYLSGSYFGGYNTNTWYRIELEVNPSSSSATARIYDGNGNQLYSGSTSTTGASNLQYVQMYYDDGDSNTVYFDDVSYSTSPPNDAPQFNSSSITPDPPLIGENVSYGAEVYDPDGSVDYTNLTLEYGGSTVVSDAQRTGTTPSWNDIYQPSGGNKWLNATLETVDDQGAVTTTTIDRYLSNEAPTVNLNKPGNTTYYKYDVPVDFSVSDSDSNPGEDWNCDINKDGSLFEEVYLKEGTNSTFTGTIDSDKGQHNASVSCKDGAGNTGSSSQDYTVTRYEIDSTSTQTPVYETENTTYTVQYTLGNMVNEITTDLFWDAVNRESRTDTNTGVNTVTLDLYYRPELVNSNNTVKNWEIQSQINYTKFQSTDTATASKTSGSNTQNIWFGYHTPKTSISQSKVIEKENIDTDLTYTNELNPGPATKTGELTFNGSTATKFDNNFDTPLVPSNSANIDKNSSGKLTISFNGNTREMTAAEDTVTVYKKILTDCSNSVNGVTGTQALVFELKNEENRSQSLKGTVDYNFDTTHHGEHTRNYAFENRNKTQGKICLYPDWAEYNITGPVVYESQKDQNSLNLEFPDRQFQINNDKITNTSETIDLYLLENSLATTTYIEVIDAAGNGVSSVTIKTMRYFVGTDSFLTVAKSVTDSQGVATTHLRVNQIYYKNLLTKDGNVLKETDKEIITCQTTPCTITFQVGNKISKYFEQKEGFSYKLERIKDQGGNVTGLQATVNHNSGSINNATLQVEKQAVVGYENTCDINTSSTGQTMICDFNETLEGNVFKYRLTGAKEGIIYTLDTGVLDEGKGLFGKSSPWAAAMIFLVITSLGMVSPKTSIAFGAAGFVVTWWIGLITVSVASVASVVLIAAAVLLTGET